MEHLLFLVHVLMWASLSVADICTHLPGYTVHGTSCFKLTDRRQTWAEAEASCVADGGHLASIHSTEEQAFVSGLVPGIEDPWIGLTGSPPIMTWSDSTDVDYEHWYGSEPDEDTVSCTRLRSSSGFSWQDVACDKNNEYICRTDGADQTQVYFTKIPDGVPTAAAVVPSSSQTVRSAIGCAWRCQQDAQCVHFIMSEDVGNYLCETYTSLSRPATATPPTDNYQRIV